WPPTILVSVRTRIWSGDDQHAGCLVACAGDDYWIEHVRFHHRPRAFSNWFGRGSMDRDHNDRWCTRSTAPFDCRRTSTNCGEVVLQLAADEFDSRLAGAGRFSFWREFMARLARLAD